MTNNLHSEQIMAMQDPADAALADLLVVTAGERA